MVGAFPINTPFSNWGFTGPTNQPGNTITISFSGATPEALNPIILSEFNQNAGVLNIRNNSGVLNNYGNASSARDISKNSWYKQHRVPTYDEISGQVTFLTGKPFIIRGPATAATSAGSTVGIPKKYYLVWADRNT